MIMNIVIRLYNWCPFGRQHLLSQQLICCRVGGDPLGGDVDLVDVDSGGAGPSQAGGEREEGDGEDVAASGVADGDKEDRRQHQACGHEEAVVRWDCLSPWQLSIRLKDSIQRDTKPDPTVKLFSLYQMFFFLLKLETSRSAFRASDPIV